MYDRAITDLETASKKPYSLQVAQRSNLADTDQATGASTARGSGQATENQDMEAGIGGEDLILSEDDVCDMDPEVAKFRSDFLKGWHEETARRKKAEREAAATDSEVINEE
jgi:hypothetical protein